MRKRRMREENDQFCEMLRGGVQMFANFVKRDSPSLSRSGSDDEYIALGVVLVEELAKMCFLFSDASTIERR